MTDEMREALRQLEEAQTEREAITAYWLVCTLIEMGAEKTTE